MLNVRRICRAIYEDHVYQTIFISRKSTKSKGSVIKTFNLENKYLFGKLIETQKEKRRILKIKKDEEKRQSVDKKCNTFPVAQSTKITNETENHEVIKQLKPSTKKEKLKSDKIKMAKAKHNFMLDNNSISLSNKLDNETSDKSSVNCTSLSNVMNFNETSNVCTHDSASLNLDKCKTQPLISGTNRLSNIINFPLENSIKSLVVPENLNEIRRVTLDDPEVKKNFSKFPSVSKIISSTMSEASLSALKRWRAKMISELGEEKFQIHYAEQLSRGSEFHETIRKKLMGETISVNNEAITASMKSLQWIWPLLSSTIAVESHIFHPELCYRGITDCIAKFKETPVVIEWKLSDKPKPQLQDTYDAPVQVSAYVGAFNYDNNFTFQINHGLVVVAYSNGSPADAFFLAPKHFDVYWKIWLEKLNKFYNLERLHTDHNMPEV
uniref:Mitochondrial genome maintenance exonuclease 1 n=1 Tax=Clastoptera arizonana TaxID=38151 RepID=A0A1B6CNX4_9HEMI